jgi:hypothetical protein
MTATEISPASGDFDRVKRPAPSPGGFLENSKSSALWSVRLGGFRSSLYFVEVCIGGVLARLLRVTLERLALG